MTRPTTPSSDTSDINRSALTDKDTQRGASSGRAEGHLPGWADEKLRDLAGGPSTLPLPVAAGWTHILRSVREVTMPFVNRAEAGRGLAAALTSYAGRDVVVVGLPRGGVPVAFEVARALGAPLDVIVVRKLGVPVQPELGMGAVGEADALVINDDVVRAAQVTAEELAEIERRERAEVQRRAQSFRGNRSPVALSGRTVIVVDDGIATGSTARAACQVARAQGAAVVVLAVPVGPEGVEQRIRPDADVVVCLSSPAEFHAVGQCYSDFAQTSDEQVAELLRAATHVSR